LASPLFATATSGDRRLGGIRGSHQPVRLRVESLCTNILFAPLYEKASSKTSTISEIATDAFARNIANALHHAGDDFIGCLPARFSNSFAVQPISEQAPTFVQRMDAGEKGR
jgi:hypothetical protein